MKITRKWNFIFIVFVVFLVVIGTVITANAEENMLVVGYSRAPDTLDIHKSTWLDITTSLVVTPPVNMSSKDGSIIPGLASSYDISDGGKIVTLHLRKGIKDAKGYPITAEDLKFAYDRYKNPETKSPSVGLILNQIKEIKILDELTVQLIYDKPYGPLLTFLTSQSAGLFSKKYYEEVGAETFGQKPLGTGLYYTERLK